jgi:hypothetical protein
VKVPYFMLLKRIKTPNCQCVRTFWNWQLGTCPQSEHRVMISESSVLGRRLAGPSCETQRSPPTVQAASPIRMCKAGLRNEFVTFARFADMKYG